MRLVLVLFLAFPALAQGPDLSLLQGREIPYDCTKGICTLKEDDLRWMHARDKAMGEVLDTALDQLQACRFKRA